MIGWRVWDVMRAIDWLVTREEVDPGRVALVGISGGGTVALYTAALDVRVAATVLSCSFCTFRDSIFSISHCIDNYVPGILKWFEMADLAGMVAPRALFVEGGSGDPLFPEAGVRTAVEQAREIYQRTDASAHFQYDFFRGDHEFAGNSALPFLDACLS
jgi:dienelactone hydrolase